MTDFKSLLERFLNNELERNALVLQLEQLLSKTPNIYNEVQSYLAQLHKENQLSLEDYAVLKPHLEQFYEKTLLRETTSDSSNMKSAKTTNEPQSSDSQNSQSTWLNSSKWIDSKEVALEQGVIIRENYRLEEEIGKGGMGIVWKATDLVQEMGHSRDKYVAIKFLNPIFKQHPDALKAVVREFARYKRLSHPNIVKAYELNRSGSTVFMVMECLQGMPLAQFIKDNPNGIPLEEAEPIIRGMAQALDHAHKEGIVHLDFKPNNVFYNPETQMAKVIDFGIARPLKQIEREKTLYDPVQLGALTHSYASYEMHLALEPAPSDDIYALACITYELLSGKHPFNRKNAPHAVYENLYDNLSSTPIKKLKPQQYQALLHALALKRTDRTLTVEAFLAEIFPQETTGKSSNLNKGWISTVIILLVLLMGGIVGGSKMGFFSSEPPKNNEPEPPPKVPEQSKPLPQQTQLSITKTETPLYVPSFDKPLLSVYLWKHKIRFAIEPYLPENERTRLKSRAERIFTEMDYKVVNQLGAANPKKIGHFLYLTEKGRKDNLFKYSKPIKMLSNQETKKGSVELHFALSLHNYSGGANAFIYQFNSALNKLNNTQ